MTVKRIPNPALVVPDEEWPLKAWVLCECGGRFQTVSVQVRKGNWLAIVVGDDSVRGTGRSRVEAEVKAVENYRRRRASRSAKA